MIIQLNPPLWFNTPKGLALCHFLIDRGPENELEFVCFQQETGECWSWTNPDIRIAKNVTLGRILDSKK